ncbi:hypothetical protein BDW66DRAFT_166670 [Aspergillus desertorum]
MAMDAGNLKVHPYGAPQVSEVDSGQVYNSTSTEYKRHPIYSPSEWLLETLSSLLAMGLLIAIACIFTYMDGKRLSDWDARVSLSATISILTTAYTTALMHGVSTFIGQLKWRHFKDGPQRLSNIATFDEASRGVWGSIQLLTTVKWNLATIGAAITILRLAFSAFSQQVILIEQREVFTPSDTATFGYAHNYTRNINGDLANTGISGIPQDPGMQSAIVRGLYGIVTPATFSCPGACNWTGPYASLGFKSACQNVTEEALRSAACESDEFSGQCNMTAPNGVGVSYRYHYTELATSYYMNASSLLGRLGLSEKPDTFPEITRFAIYRSSPTADFASLDINVTQCSLYLTAYEYADAKANGTEFSFGQTREVNFGLGGSNPWTYEGSIALLGRLRTNETTAENNFTIPALEISEPDLLALGNFFESSTIVTEWVKGFWENTNLGLAAALQGDVDIPARFEYMAASMTDYLRNGPNMLIGTGDTVQSVPFVAIRWGYFVVPIVTEAPAALFAVLTVVSNRRSKRVPLWKSSMLAVLACQVDERAGLLKGDAGGRDINELQQAAGKTEVRLQ